MHSPFARTVVSSVSHARVPCACQVVLSARPSHHHAPRTHCRSPPALHPRPSSLQMSTTHMALCTCMAAPRTALCQCTLSTAGQMSPCTCGSAHLAASRTAVCLCLMPRQPQMPACTLCQVRSACNTPRARVCVCGGGLRAFLQHCSWRAITSRSTHSPGIADVT